MGKPEDMDVERFFSEPGETSSSPNAPDQAAPAARDVPENVDEEGFLVTEPSAEVPPSEPTAEPSQIDTAKIMDENEALRVQNQNLQSLMGSQGQRLGDLERQLQWQQGMIQRGMAPETDTGELDEPVTKRDLQQYRLQWQREQFLSETAQRDQDFATRAGLDAAKVQEIRSFGDRRGILSVEDAYHVMVAQGVIKQPKKPIPSVAARKMPVETGSGKARPESRVAVSPDTRLKQADPKTIGDAIRRKYYPELV